MEFTVDPEGLVGRAVERGEGTPSPLPTGGGVWEGNYAPPQKKNEFFT